MLYNLTNETPAIQMIGPDNADFWAKLAGELPDGPGGRHALVIGNHGRPAEATVIVGTALELARYVDPFKGPLSVDIIRMGAQARMALTPEQMDELRPKPEPEQQHAPVEPVDPNLIELPHSGLRVLHDGLRVSSYRQMATSDGVAFTANLRVDGDIVGFIENSGHGGQPTYCGTGAFTSRDLDVYVMSCQAASGRRPSEEDVLDALINFSDCIEHWGVHHLRLHEAYMSAMSRTTPKRQGRPLRRNRP